MKPLTTIIIDDEPPARLRIRQLVESDPELHALDEAADGRSGLTLLRRTKPDLLFLDVQMPELSGIELLGHLPAGERPAVVFVTAYDEFALKAFELHAVDYLLKPFQDARWRAAVDRVKARLRNLDIVDTHRRIDAVLRELASRSQRTEAKTGGTPAVADRLAVRVSGELLFIRFDEIRWIEGAGDYLRLHTRQGTPLIRETFKELLTRLDRARFARIHKSSVVNTACIARIRPAASGDYEVELDDGTTLTVSRLFRQNLGEVHGLAWSRASG